MANHDYNIANQTMANARADINNALAAILSRNSGASAPTTTVAYMSWPDTANGIMKQRNAADSDWISLYVLGKQGLIPQDFSTVAATAGGSSNAFTLSLTPTPTAYTTHQVVFFKANHTITGAATLNIDSLGAKSIKKNTGDALVSGDIESGQCVAVMYDGTNFQLLNPVLDYLAASAIGSTVQAYDAATVFTDTASVFTAQQNFGTATLTDGATVNWNLATQQVAKLTLGGNRTMAAPTNIVDGGTYVLRVIQDGTGSRTLTWNSVFKWPGGTAPTLSTAASAIDIITFVGDGTNLYGVAATTFS